jgi:hypothetical protein
MLQIDQHKAWRWKMNSAGGAHGMGHPCIVPISTGTGGKIF